jgi:hypothetical protein
MTTVCRATGVGERLAVAAGPSLAAGLLSMIAIGAGMPNWTGGLGAARAWSVLPGPFCWIGVLPVGPPWRVAARAGLASSREPPCGSSTAAGFAGASISMATCGVSLLPFATGSGTRRPFCARSKTATAPVPTRAIRPAARKCHGEKLTRRSPQRSTRARRRALRSDTTDTPPRR